MDGSIIKFIFSTTAAMAVLIFIGKLLIERLVDSQFERYKRSLDKETEDFKHELSLKVEKFRHSLNTASIEHQIKFTKLHEERGMVIGGIYRQLLKIQRSLEDLTSLFQGPEWAADRSRDDKVRSLIFELKNQLEENRLFFDAALCDKIDSIITDFLKVVADMGLAKNAQIRVYAKRQSGQKTDTTEEIKPFDTWMELGEKVKRDINEARLNLVQEFRLLIGVVSN